MPAGQSKQALQDTHAFDAALLDHGFGPAAAVRTQAAHFAQEPGGAPLHAADLAVGQVLRLRAEAARFMPGMQGNLLQTLVEDAYQPAVPAHPHGTRQILRRHRVVGTLDLDVAVAVDDTPAFAETGKALQRQPLQGGPLDLAEQDADLPARSAVDARVGDGLLPIEQEAIGFVEAGEHAALQGVLLDVVHTAFDLALVPRRVRLGGQQGDAIVLAEGADLGIDLGVEPIGFGDGGLEIVEDQALRHAAEVPEGVLQATEECLGGLARHGFAVSLAGITEHDAEDVRPPPPALGVLGRRPFAEIDLGFLAGAAFEAAERQLLLRGQAADKAAHAVILAAEAVLDDQVLIDALGGQALIELGLNDRAKRLTEAGLSGGFRCRRQHGTADRPGWFGAGSAMRTNGR